MVCIIIIIKLSALLYKKDKENKELMKWVIQIKEATISNDIIIETDNLNEKIKTSNEDLTIPIITSKNKWLYPEDDFGNMTKGKVYNSIRYESGIIVENSSLDKMKIITKKKKKNNRK